LVPHPRPDLVQKDHCNPRRNVARARATNSDNLRIVERERKQFEYQQRAAHRQQLAIERGEAPPLANVAGPAMPLKPVITAA
jgi:hypothetical protein